MKISLNLEATHELINSAHSDADVYCVIDLFFNGWIKRLQDPKIINKAQKIVSDSHNCQHNLKHFLFRSLADYYFLNYVRSYSFKDMTSWALSIAIKKHVGWKTLKKRQFQGFSEARVLPCIGDIVQSYNDLVCSDSDCLMQKEESNAQAKEISTTINAIRDWFTIENK